MDEILLSKLANKIAAAGLPEGRLGCLLTLHRLLSSKIGLIDSFDLLDAAIRQPPLFYMKPETLYGNVVASARLLRITEMGFVAVALKQPQLFYQKPETLYGNVVASARLLGVTEAGFVAAAVKQPSLFYQRPETLHGNVVASAQLLDITEAGFVAAALKQPPLFYQKPETLHGNVVESARLLDIAKAAFVIAALKHPSLFTQKPETLHGNVVESARLLGVTEAGFITAALKQPPLFCQKPETLYGKKSYIEKLREALGGDNSFTEVIRIAPAALCYGTSHLHARFVLAKLGLKRGKVSSLVTLPARTVDALIVGHFMARIAATGKGARALQVMQAQGIIKELPEGIRPIPKAVRRQRERNIG